MRTRKWKNIVHKKNIKAFKSVLSQYNRLRYKSLVYTPSYEDMQAKTTIVRRGIVTASDFLCDCELAWEHYTSPREITEKFLNTFVLDEECDIMTPGQILMAQNFIGAEFIRRKIYPIKQYFKGEKL